MNRFFLSYFLARCFSLCEFGTWNTSEQSQISLSPPTLSHCSPVHSEGVRVKSGKVLKAWNWYVQKKPKKQSNHGENKCRYIWTLAESVPWISALSLPPHSQLFLKLQHLAGGFRLLDSFINRDPTSPPWASTLRQSLEKHCPLTGRDLGAEPHSVMGGHLPRPVVLRERQNERESENYWLDNFWWYCSVSSASKSFQKNKWKKLMQGADRDLRLYSYLSNIERNKPLICHIVS